MQIRERNGMPVAHLDTDVRFGTISGVALQVSEAPVQYLRVSRPDQIFSAKAA